MLLICGVPGPWLVSFPCIVPETFQAFAIALSVFDDRVYEALRIYYWSRRLCQRSWNNVEYILETLTYTQCLQIFYWSFGINNCLFCAIQCQLLHIPTNWCKWTIKSSFQLHARFYQTYQMYQCCLYLLIHLPGAHEWRLFRDFPGRPYSSGTW